MTLTTCFAKLLLVAALCSLTMLISAHNVVRAHKVVRVYTIHQFDNQGKPLPLPQESAVLLAYLEQAMQIRFEVHFVPWTRAMDAALKNDVLLFGMSITKDRLKKYAFSEPISINANWLVTRCDSSFKYEALNDLKDKLIGVVLGTSSGDHFDQEAGTLFRIENDTGTGVSRLKKLHAHRMDALVWYGATTDVKQIEEHVNYTFNPNSYIKGKSKPIFCVQEKPISIVSNHLAMRINANNIKLLKSISISIEKGRKEHALPSLRLP